MPGSWVLILLMLMVVRLGLSVMASKLVEGRGERGQKSCQPQHCILLSCWTQGQAGSERLGTTISLVSRSQVRTASWSMLGICQTIRHCHTVTLTSSLSTLLSLIKSARNVSTNQRQIDPREVSRFSQTIFIWSSLVDDEGGPSFVNMVRILSIETWKKIEKTVLCNFLKSKHNSQKHLISCPNSCR